MGHRGAISNYIEVTGVNQDWSVDIYDYHKLSALSLSLTEISLHGHG